MEEVVFKKIKLFIELYHICYNDIGGSVDFVHFKNLLLKNVSKMREIQRNKFWKKVDQNDIVNSMIYWNKLNYHLIKNENLNYNFNGEHFSFNTHKEMEIKLRIFLHTSEPLSKINQNNVHEIAEYVHDSLGLIEYLEDYKTSKIMQNADIVPILALPYVKKPWNHAYFSTFYKNEWRHNFLKNLEVYISQIDEIFVNTIKTKDDLILLMMINIDCLNLLFNESNFEELRNKVLSVEKISDEINSYDSNERSFSNNLKALSHSEILFMKKQQIHLDDLDEIKLLIYLANKHDKNGNGAQVLYAINSKLSLNEVENTKRIKNLQWIINYNILGLHNTKFIENNLEIWKLYIYSENEDNYIEFLRLINCIASFSKGRQYLFNYKRFCEHLLKKFIYFKNPNLESFQIINILMKINKKKYTMNLIKEQSFIGLIIDKISMIINEKWPIEYITCLIAILLNECYYINEVNKIFDLLNSLIEIVIKTINLLSSNKKILTMAFSLLNIILRWNYSYKEELIEKLYKECKNLLVNIESTNKDIVKQIKFIITIILERDEKNIDNDFSNKNNLSDEWSEDKDMDDFKWQLNYNRISIIDSVEKFDRIIAPFLKNTSNLSTDFNSNKAMEKSFKLSSYSSDEKISNPIQSLNLKHNFDRTSLNDTVNIKENIIKTSKKEQKFIENTLIKHFNKYEYGKNNSVVRSKSNNIDKKNKR